MLRLLLKGICIQLFVIIKFAYRGGLHHYKGGCSSMCHEETEICLMIEAILPHTVMLRLLVSMMKCPLMWL